MLHPPLDCTAAIGRCDWWLVEQHTGAKTQTHMLMSSAWKCVCGVCSIQEEQWDHYTLPLTIKNQCKSSISQIGPGRRDRPFYWHPAEAHIFRHTLNTHACTETKLCLTGKQKLDGVTGNLNQSRAQLIPKEDGGWIWGRRIQRLLSTLTATPPLQIGGRL